MVDYISDLYVNPSKFKLENNSDYSLLEDDSTAFEYWILNIEYGILNIKVNYMNNALMI